MFERFTVQHLLRVVQAYIADRAEETSLKNKFNVESVLHALEIVCRILDYHNLALGRGEIMRVDFPQESTADPQLLVGR